MQSSRQSEKISGIPCRGASAVFCHSTLGADCSKPVTASRELRPAPSAFATLLAAGALAVILLLVILLPDSVRLQLQYDRTALLAGEWWRLITANLVHLGWGHVLLNAAGLLLIGWIFARDRSLAQWAFALACAGLGASLGALALRPDVLWLAGLSGALHGLFVFGVLAWLEQGERLGWWLLGLVGAKLAYEQTVGSMPMTADIAGGPVITEAHLAGALGGLVAGGLLAVWQRMRRSL